LRELKRAIIFTTEMSNVPPPVPENPVGRKTVSAVKHNKVKSDCQPQIFSGPIQ
jgi:hypothetical protein